jgi:hypothetical protein
VSRIQLDGSDLALNVDEAFEEGWHGHESYAEHSHRLTSGRTPLPAGTRLIMIDRASRGYYWVKPERSVVPFFGQVHTVAGGAENAGRVTGSRRAVKSSA